MEPSTAVKSIFLDRYLINGTSRMSVSNVDKLLTEISASDNDQQLLVATSGLQLVRNRWESTHCLGALQLLAAIKQGLYTEEPRLQYNYFGMHKRCIEILRLIKAKEDHKFRQYFDADYMPDDTMISNLVFLVLTVAQGSGIASQQLGFGSRGGSQISSRIVVSCEEVMAEYLRANGDKACKELKAFCRNNSLGEARGFEVESKEYNYWFCVEDVIDPASLAAFQTGIKIA